MTGAGVFYGAAASEAQAMRGQEVCVVGDVRHGSTKRVAAAVGEGSVTIRMVHRCLSSG